MRITNIGKSILFASLVIIISGTAETRSFAARWAVPDGTYFFIKQVKSGTPSKGNAAYWDQSGQPGRYNKGSNLQLWSKDSGFNHDQQFRIFTRSNGWYALRSRNGGYVDVSGGRNADGVPLQMWNSNRSDAQLFRFRYLGGGRWKIYTRGGRIIASKGRNSGNGTRIHTWRDHNDRSSEWYFVDAGGRILTPKREQSSGNGSLDPAAGGRSNERTSVTLARALQSDDQSILNRYFSEVSYSQLHTDDVNRKIPEKFSSLGSAAKQWTMLTKIIDATEDNNNSSVRIRVYRTLSNVQFRDSSFVERLLAGKMKEIVMKKAHSERSSSARRYLESIANNIR